MTHVRVARETRLVPVAVLLPLPPLEQLLLRNAARPEHEQVPPVVLSRQHHRRSLLTASMLAQEGFRRVYEP